MKRFSRSAQRPALAASALLLALLAGRANAQALGTAFTYQGSLTTSGTPANGLHDLRFRLYDALAGGSQVGSTLCSDNVGLIDGRFAVELDFGAVFSGQERYLEIEVRPDTGLSCGNIAGFTILGPRQRLSGAPNALFALTSAAANNATQLGGQAASFYRDATNLNAGTIPNARVSGLYSSVLTLSNAANSFTGSGAGLGALNASNITTGTLADARLSTNVVLTSGAQTLSGVKAFSAAPSFAAAGAPFSVSSPTLVPNLNADMLDGLNASAFLQAVPSPLSLAGTSSTAIITAQNADLAGAGVRGTSTSATGSGVGVYGMTAAASGDAVAGFATSTTGLAWGVRGESSSASGRGVYGRASSGTGNSYGMFAENDSISGVGVYGHANAITGTTYGGLFETASASGTGAYGRGPTTGVEGLATGTSSARGVHGVASATTGLTYGGLFETASSSGVGLRGAATANTGSARGIEGFTAAPTGTAIHGQAGANSGLLTYGVHGESESTAGIGVHGSNTTTTGTTVGGQFEVWSTTGIGAQGVSYATTGVNYGGHFRTASSLGTGVYGEASAAASTQNYGGYFTAAGSLADAVHAVATATSGSAWGVNATSASDTGIGVFGTALSASGNAAGVRGDASSAAGYGVYGFNSASAGFAVYAAGKFGASGTKSFRIDHPDDPANAYLVHYSMESPEVLNVYSGITFLDGSGAATIELPAYFARINRDPRYTLTPIGAPMPTLYVAEEIDASAFSAAAADPGVPAPRCTFSVAGGAPGGKVSWEIKGVRNDRWVRANGAPVEVPKVGAEVGTYQHPELYGQPASKGAASVSDKSAKRVPPAND